MLLHLRPAPSLLQLFYILSSHSHFRSSAKTCTSNSRWKLAARRPGHSHWYPISDMVWYRGECQEKKQRISYPGRAESFILIYFLSGWLPSWRMSKPLIAYRPQVYAIFFIVDIGFVHNEGDVQVHKVVLLFVQIMSITYQSRSNGII